MAGEAVLSSFMEVLFDKLYTSAANELRSIWGVNKDLEDLSNTLSMIQELLEDAEEKQLTDRPVRIWLSKLKDVAYEMDDLLDEHEAEHLRLKLEGRDSTQSHSKLTKVSVYFSSSYLYKGLSRFKTAHRIKAIRKKMDKYARERDMLSLQVLGNASRLDIAELPRPQTSSLVDDLNVLGREKDKEEIIKRLLLPSDCSRRTNIPVLPIVGMGGLGKTTLAQIVYNDSRVRNYFQLRMWICVSENFDEIKLTKETLQSAVSGRISAANSGRLGATTNMNLLQEELCDSLKGQRFLLVLDDVWNENPQKWERFCISLRGAGSGSKIIVTTQNANVGVVMGASPPHILERLSDSDCWNLFRNCAFVNGDTRGHPNLEEIGKKIVNKLQGLPLAAKTLGSLLYSKLDEEDWKNVLSSEIWELPLHKNNILPALRLSYKHLPPHLKRCFAFCSVFHKDYVFHKEKLVQIWMALGYIKPQGSRRVEDIGNSYFDDLLSRSFFQPYKGNYVMHDSIHDLAQSLSIGECRRLEQNDEKGQSSDSYPNTRHLSYSCHNSGSTSFEAFFGFNKLRTLLLLRGYKSHTSGIPDSLFVEQKCLRVLDLYRRDITELPHSIGNLIQLRFLSLSGTGIETLPSSISKLYNLQTLKLKHCNLLDEIPKGVTNLTNLRHLEASTRLVSKIAGIGRLTHLQELEEFTIRDDSGFSIRELKGMAELHGELCIRNLECVRSREEASEANLENKGHLSVLHLIWTDDQQHVSFQAKYQHEKVLEGLKPHNQLKELTINGYGGTKFPSWLWSSSRCYLQTIHLSNCRSCLILPSLGQLPFLKYLDIGGFGAIQIGQEFSGEGVMEGFLSLKELVVEDMPDLELWSWTQENCLFPCLVELEITECPKLNELPQLPSTLTQLRISEVGLGALPVMWRHPYFAIQPALMSLQIHECPNLRSLQQGLLGQQLIALEELTIINCKELATLPVECFQPLLNLRSLHIYNCPKLAVEDSGCGLLPSSLKDIQISSCSNLISPLLEDLWRLTNLTNLKISDCSGFSCFSDKGLPPSLKSFGIIGCVDLQFFPEELREVSSLETLLIRNCQRIARLPDKGLPSMLRELYIQDCPLLKESCQAYGIAHIPVVDVDGERISESGFRRSVNLFEDCY